MAYFPSAHYIFYWKPDTTDTNQGTEFFGNTGYVYWCLYGTLQQDTEI